MGQHEQQEAMKKQRGKTDCLARSVSGLSSLWPGEQQMMTMWLATYCRSVTCKKRANTSPGVFSLSLSHSLSLYSIQVSERHYTTSFPFINRPLSKSTKVHVISLLVKFFLIYITWVVVLYVYACMYVCMYVCIYESQRGDEEEKGEREKRNWVKGVKWKWRWDWAA